MNPKYAPKTVDQKLGKLVEECGEVLAAVGKTQRWGLESTNPDLPQPSETNREWILRELRDLDESIAIVRAAIAPAAPPVPAPTTVPATEGGEAVFSAADLVTEPHPVPHGVTVRHVPTGTTVSVASEPSRHKNLSAAVKMIRKELSTPPAPSAPPEAAKVPTHVTSAERAKSIDSLFGLAPIAVGVIEQAIAAAEDVARDRAAQQPPVASINLRRLDPDGAYDTADDWCKDFAEQQRALRKVVDLSEGIALIDAKWLRRKLTEQSPVAEGGLRERACALSQCHHYEGKSHSAFCADTFELLESVASEARAAALPDGAREALREFNALPAIQRKTIMGIIELGSWDETKTVWRLLRALAGTTP